MGFFSQVLNKAVQSKAARKLELSNSQQLIDRDDQSEEVDVGNLKPNQLGTISGQAVILEYENIKGEKTQRIVTCKRYYKHGNEGYLWAFCQMRKQTRQFKISRIIEIGNPRTGEMFVSVAVFFELFSPDQSHVSKPGWGLSENKKADLIALLNVLVFIANCDKDFHDLERSLFEDCIGKFWLRFEGPGDPDIESIGRYIANLAPDGETFWVALHQIASDAKLVRLTKQCVADMIDADGVHAQQELYWGQELDNFFRDNA